MSYSYETESWGEHRDKEHGVRDAGSQVQACHLLAVQLWVNNLTSLNLYMLLDQMGLIIYVYNTFIILAL